MRGREECDRRDKLSSLNFRVEEVMPIIATHFPCLRISCFFIFARFFLESIETCD